MSERDVDAEFAAIIAGWDSEPSSPAQDSAGATGSPGAPGETGTEPEDAGPGPRPHVNPPYAVPPVRPHTSPSVPPAPGPVGPSAPGTSPSAAASENAVSCDFPVWRGPTSSAAGTRPAEPFEELEDEDDHFVPPSVTLPPHEDLHYWGVVAGFAAGPLILIYVLLAQPYPKTWWLLGALGSFLAAFALLIVRQPRHRDPEDDDNGARV